MIQRKREEKCIPEGYKKFKIISLGLKDNKKKSIKGKIQIIKIQGYKFLKYRAKHHKLSGTISKTWNIRNILVRQNQNRGLYQIRKPFHMLRSSLSLSLFSFLYSKIYEGCSKERLYKLKMKEILLHKEEKRPINLQIRYVSGKEKSRRIFITRHIRKISKANLKISHANKRKLPTKIPSQCRHWG